MERVLNITVMLGGPSAEREVSLRSGAAVAEALRRRGHRVDELDPRQPGWALASGQDAVFLALHGSYGEDGTVQAELDRLGVPYTGCGAEASRLAFDKVASKERFVECGVPTAPFRVATAAEHPRLVCEFNPPVVLKPALQGSSVGLQFVEREEDYEAGLRQALEHGDVILVEPKIRGREVTVGLLGGEVLPVVEIRPRISAPPTLA
jgi:D-alanine-D-alanine ligase